MIDTSEHYSRAAKLLAEARECQRLRSVDEMGTLVSLSRILSAAAQATAEQQPGIVEIYDPVFALVTSLLDADPSP